MTIKTVRNLRRISQIVFFAIFFWLILKTTFEVNLTPETATEIRLPYPVSIGLQFDPLIALATILSSWTLYKGLLWSLVILIPTIFMGRFSAVGSARWGRSITGYRRCGRSELLGAGHGAPSPIGIISING